MADGWLTIARKVLSSRRCVRLYFLPRERVEEKKGESARSRGRKARRTKEAAL